MGEKKGDAESVLGEKEVHGGWLRKLFKRRRSLRRKD